MFNEMIVVAVTPFSGTSTPDKNGKMSVMLQLIAGKMPNRNVMSGTVAERAGIEAGRTYLMNVRESGYDKIFGKDFTFTKVKELMTGLDIANVIKEIGNPEIITIERPEGFEDKYTRSGNAVESIKTKRVKEGLYEKAINTSSDHKTASKIVEGDSQHVNNPKQNLGEEDLKK